MSIAENYAAVMERIADSAARAGVRADDVTLVCVSKLKPVADIEAACAAGACHFGENHVQEFVDKYAELQKKSKIFWHFIGQLQSNKVKYITSKVGLLHSLDRLSLTAELDKRLSAAGETMDCLIEVNVSKEDTKAGVLIEDLPALIDAIGETDTINVRGLMTIAPLAGGDSAARKCFSQTRKLFERLGSQRSERFSMDILSMGMSGDFEIAIEEGATLVRVGSAIFGGR